MVHTHMPIHTIGDSHSYNGWSGVILHHLGPVLCHSFGKEPLNRCDIRNIGINDGDTIVFCFGEIDCRCHVHKHVTVTKSYQTIIDEIVCNYFEAIKLNVVTSQIQNMKICVYNVVPPVQKHNRKESPEYPFLGTDEERQKYVVYFNVKLKQKCAEYGYIFFDIYRHYVDEYGFLRKDLSDGCVHIGDGVHIRNFIHENKLE